MNTTDFENGTVYINGEKAGSVPGIEWTKHPKFNGVFTKNLFTGKDSSNNLSAMIVKIEPDHFIGLHTHEGKSELHEVISGDGTATVEDYEISYRPGVISFIPADTAHSIRAGERGMILLAKFTPPLN